MHTLAWEGLRVRPLTVVAGDMLNVKHSSSPEVPDVIDIGRHWIGVLSVNWVEPF